MYYEQLEVITVSRLLFIAMSMNSEKLCIDLLQLVTVVFKCHLQQKTIVHKVLTNAVVLLMQVHFSNCLQCCFALVLKISCMKQD